MLRGAALLPPVRAVVASRSSRRAAQTRTARPRAEMASATADAEPRDRVGFKRAEMFSEPLYGTVKPYKTHIFVAYGAASTWAGKLETAEGPLKALTDAAEARQDALKATVGKLKITAYEPSAEAGDEEGDVILYPQMVRLRPAPSPEALLDALSADGGASLQGHPLADPAVFVCCHARRDKRCGVCGPALMESFSAALSARHLSTVPVRGCSHIGGHAYAGNVLVFSRGAGAVSADGSADPSAAAAAVRGDWFGYVAPEDVGGIIDGHIVRGEDPEPRLWRGRMGMSIEEHSELAKAALARIGGADGAKGSAGCGPAAAGASGGSGAGGGGCEGCDSKCDPAAPQPGAAGGGGLFGWAMSSIRGAVAGYGGGYGVGGGGGPPQDGGAGAGGDKPRSG